MKQDMKAGVPCPRQSASNVQQVASSSPNHDPSDQRTAVQTSMEIGATATQPTVESADTTSSNTTAGAAVGSSTTAAAGDSPDKPTSGTPTQTHEGQRADGAGAEDASIEQLTTAIAGLTVDVAATSLPVVPDLVKVAQQIASGRARKIVCMCGAGISVSAGIPDFRTPGTGLYSQLEKYGLPFPEAVFEINFFNNNPAPFYLLAKELWPGTYAPTPTHFFMRLLHDKGLLLRCYTQNIDSLETQAGLPKEAVIAAHGNFDGAHCTRCKRAYEVEDVKAAAMQGTPMECQGQSCKGYVKPSIVFFGEALPTRFHQMFRLDFSGADLLIVMGTSLVVQPFASLINMVGDDVPRLLINRELVGQKGPGGFDLSPHSRDCAFLGDCDDGAWQLAELLGWKQELEALIAGWGQPAAAEAAGDKAEQQSAAASAL